RGRGHSRRALLLRPLRVPGSLRAGPDGDGRREVPRLARRREDQADRGGPRVSADLRSLGRNCWSLGEPVLLAKVGNPEALTVDGYRKAGGYQALAKALAMKPDDVIEVVKASGLRGRGGAG